MITVGVDLAAEPKNTAAVVIDWAARTITPHEAATDDDLVALCRGADKIGIDCPFGWPDAFVDFVVRHRAFLPTPPADSIALRRPFAYRATDLWCRDRGHRPLSVSADRIAHAALRCAGLLSRLDVTDRSGAGRVVETYPAGSVRVWFPETRRYKEDAAFGRNLLELLGLACELSSEHVLDALLACLTARAAALGNVHPVPPEHATAARVEGWIALPSGPLLAAVSPTPRTASAADRPVPRAGR